MGEAETLVCASCGKQFPWQISEKLHHPKDCPEGLDGFCPNCDPAAYEPPTECKSCRPKQDMQRS